MGNTQIISCEIANQPTNMVLDMGSEVTIIQEWWFDEYLNWLLKRCVFVVAARSCQLVTIPICGILYCGCKFIGNHCEG